MIRKIKDKEGITLIALVITIVVLLILAGVAIATLNGENGLLSKSKKATQRYSYEQAREEIIIAIAGAKLDQKIEAKKQYKIASTEKFQLAKIKPFREAIKEELDKIPNNSYEPNTKEELLGATQIKGINKGIYQYTIDLEKEEIIKEEVVNEQVVQPGDIVKGENKEYTDGKGEKAIIPVGFAIVPGYDKIEEGLVISDVAYDTKNQGNQFVWIPVDSEQFTRRQGYYNGSLEDISEYSESNETGVNPKVNEDEITKQEAIDMYQNVAQKQGFYIGRYEAGKDTNGNLVVKKGADSYVNVKWGNSMTDSTGGAVALAREFGTKQNYDTTKIQTTMCYSVQRDSALKFIEPEWNNFLKDSTKKGWYVDNFNSSITGNITMNSGHKTGIDLIYSNNPNVVANQMKNIYDIAGNVYEWTMESFSTTNRALLGGSYASTGLLYSSGYRGNRSPTTIDPSFGFRCAMFLK